MAAEEKIPNDRGEPKRPSKGLGELVEQLTNLCGTLVNAVIKQQDINHGIQGRLDRLEASSQDPSIKAEAAAMRQKLDTLDAQVKILAAPTLDVGEIRLVGRGGVEHPDPNQLLRDFGGEILGAHEVEGHLQRTRGDHDVGSPTGTEEPAFTLTFPATLTAVVHHAEEGGFWAEVPALPGCFTQGETIEEVQANLREAAAGWLGSEHDRACHPTTGSRT